MHVARPAIALHPKLFGKGRMRELASSRAVATTLSADFKLFATTFVAGFLFVSILFG